MTININRFHDGETVRQQKNLTSSQKKNAMDTKEGVLVNSFIKDSQNHEFNLNDTKDLLIISDNAGMPESLQQKETSKEKSLVPISIAAVGVMGIMALLTAFILRNAKINTSMSKLDGLPATTRNIALNDETHQAIYRMIHNPTPKTILAGSGVLVLTAMAFMGKTFCDGFKEVWVKKREADIQKNLQENLIEVETRSFGGKMQIIRSLLSEKAVELNRYLSSAKTSNFSGVKKVFGGVSFGHENNKRTREKGSNLKYFILGGATLLSVAGLGYLAMKNIRNAQKEILSFIQNAKKSINSIAQTSTQESIEVDKITLTQLFREADSSRAEIEEVIRKLNWQQADKDKFTQEALKATAKVNEAMGGDGSDKTTFYSHVNDYRAHLYNYLLNRDNKSFKQLFFGITGLTAISYGGKLYGDAVKEVQVKKINAETELNLQKRLVSTELRNFKSKKDAAIQPLIEEFYRQAANGKSKQELKVIADNILLEIKNGPPFVYS